MPLSSINLELQILSAKKRPVAILVVSLLALSCFLISALAGWEIWTSRRERLADAEVSASNIVRGMASHAETSLKVAALVLDDMVERAEQDGLEGPDSERLRAHLVRTVANATELYGLFLYNATGEWKATSLSRVFALNNADRDYFKYHQTHRDRSLRISAPVRSRSSGVWVIPISRRLQHADGRFAGVALATMRLDSFEKIYGRLNVGTTGTMVLALDNGTLFYRRPFDESLIGRDISSGPLMRLYRSQGQAGSKMLTARIDGITRLYSYRHLDGFPMIVAAALSADEIYAGWSTSALQILGGLVFFLAVLLWLGRKLLRQLALREQLENQLQLARDGLTQENSELQALASKDGLTQLANRRTFDGVLSYEYARARRNPAPLSLIIFDVDFFKQYNDLYGHLAGDACLRQVAAASSERVSRQTDLVVRYGGEEFAILLPGTELHHAVSLAERVREAVLALDIPHAASRAGRVTVSLGVASIVAKSGISAYELVQAADEALYRAKHLGRNQVNVAF